MQLLHPTGLLKIFFESNWVQKPKTSTYEILKMFFSNMDFNFAHFANFNFAYFEIEESFGLVRVKLTKKSISLANFQFGY